MSEFTDIILEQGNSNQKEIIKLLKSIDEKLTYLCGQEYESKSKE